MGAGILPATLHNHKIYLLFGKESIYDKTPGWSDFAGGQEDDETFLQTAIREGTEELTGFLGSENDLKAMLRRYGTHNLTMERYRTHIFPYEYDEKLVHYYNNNQRFLQKRLPQIVLKNSRIFEKAEIRWVCLDDLMSCKRMFRPFYRTMVQMIYDDREAIRGFLQKAVTPSGKLKD
jgi:8-oxo-dGTP pyrophosphatase MutT (NUDIX family)